MIITRTEVAATSVRKLVLREGSCRIAYRPEIAYDLYHLCLIIVGKRSSHIKLVMVIKITNVDMYSGNKKILKVRSILISDT